REPQISVLVECESVRSGRRRSCRILFHLVCLWIEPAQHVAEHTRPPDRAARTRFRVMRPGTQRRDIPFPERNRECTGNNDRLRSRLWRKVRRKVIGNYITLVVGKFHHRAEQIDPFLPRIAARVGNEPQRMTLRTLRLHFFFSRSIRQRDLTTTSTLS